MKKYYLLFYLFFFFVFSSVLLFPQKTEEEKNQSVVKKLQSLDDDGKLEYYLELSNSFRDSSSKDGITFVKEGVELAKKMNRKETEGEILINLSFMYITNYNNKISLECAIEALDIGNEFNNEKIIGSANNILGLYYYKRGNYDKSYDFFLRALKFRTESGSKKELASTMNNIALVLLQLKNYNTALEYFDRSLRIKYEIDDYKAAMRTISNIALCYKELKEYDKAIAFIDSGIVLCRTYNYKNSIALLTGIYGDILLLKGDYKSALSKYYEALNVWNYMQNKKGSASVEFYLSFSRYYKAIKNTPIAVKFLDTALTIAKDSKLDGYLPRIYNELSENFETMNNFQQASAYRRLYSETKDSLDNIEKSRIIGELQALYNVEEKEKEIQKKKSQLFYAYSVSAVFILFLFLMTWMYQQKRKANLSLQKKNKEILEQKELLSKINTALNESQETTKKYAEELNEIIATKDKFFSIIAHDLRSPYHVILGLSSLLAEENSGYSEDMTKKFASQLHETALLQFKLMENLLEWGNLQRGKIPFEPVFLNPCENIESLLKIISGLASKKQVVITNLVRKEILLFADKNMFETIFRNILTNAIKFSNARDLITINGIKTDSKIVFEISDTGVGISDKVNQDLFKIDKSISTEGTLQEKGTGLGLILCKELIEKHKGSISIKSQLNVGTTVTISFPNNEKS